MFMDKVVGRYQYSPLLFYPPRNLPQNLTLHLILFEKAGAALIRFCSLAFKRNKALKEPFLLAFTYVSTLCLVYLWNTGGIILLPNYWILACGVGNRLNRW
ncbi:hypothetical protein SAY86_000061 [Trapa natans]|uniref:Uncharacterized protein n=1 Tax=Trapa natans TaxID=22666 RepID=A0AAN7RMI5_TRANT|nr:hypothetical protein SAY86_000061 [Trapa natans]